MTCFANYISTERNICILENSPPIKIVSTKWTDSYMIGTVTFDQKIAGPSPNKAFVVTLHQKNGSEVSKDKYLVLPIQFTKDNDGLIVKLKIYETVTKGYILMTKTAYSASNPLQGVIYSSENPDISLTENIKIAPVTVNQ